MVTLSARNGQHAYCSDSVVCEFCLIAHAERGQLSHVCDAPQQLSSAEQSDTCQQHTIIVSMKMITILIVIVIMKIIITLYIAAYVLGLCSPSPVLPGRLVLGVFVGTPDIQLWKDRKAKHKNM